MIRGSLFGTPNLRSSCWSSTVSAANPWATVLPTGRTDLDVTGTKMSVENNQCFHREECLNEDCPLPAG